MNEKNENNRKSNLSQNLKDNIHRRKASANSTSNIKNDMESMNSTTGDESNSDEDVSPHFKKHANKHRFHQKKNFSKNPLVRFFQKIKVFFYKLIGKRHGYFIHSNKIHKTSSYHRNSNRKFHHKPPK